MLRKAGALVAGMLVVGAVVTALQAIGARLHSVPAGLDPTDPAAIAALPPSAWVAAFCSEVVGAFLGALLAGWMARDSARAISGVIVSLALIGSITNWISFPHPIWFMVGQVVAYALVLMLAWRLLERRGGREPEVQAHAAG